MKLKVILSAAFALFSGIALAQSRPTITPQGIVVNPVATELKVQVAVNKPGVNPLYTEGEKVVFSVSVNQDAYVYVFNVAADNSVNVLLPNGFSNGSPLLRGGETRSFPPANAAYEIAIQAPFGAEKLYALASKTPLDLSSVIPQVQNNNFAVANVQGSSGLARPLALVVQPLPAQSWTSAYVDFRTQGRVAVQNNNGTLQINSNVNGAQVYVDNVLVGNTPASVTVAAGQHTVRVTASGFREETQTVNVRGGQVVNLNFNLQPVNQNGSITVLVSPNDATVFIDNVRVGNGQQTVNVAPGQHTVRVTANGFQEFNQTVNVRTGENVPVRVNLVAIVQNGTLQITNAPQNAQIFINGSSVGNGNGRITLPAGQYSVRIAAPGFQDFNQTVNVQGGQVTTVQANLQPVSGTLVVRSSVANARVFINGNDVGTIGSDGVLSIPNLPAGNHELTIVAAGFRTQVQQFSISAGQTTEVFANLIRL